MAGRYPHDEAAGPAMSEREFERRIAGLDRVIAFTVGIIVGLIIALMFVLTA